MVTKKIFPLESLTNSLKMVKELAFFLGEHIAFKIQDKAIKFGNILNSRRLFSQFLIDSYIVIKA